VGESVEPHQREQPQSKPKRWVSSAKESESATLLARELGLPEVLAQILVCRGYDSVHTARQFLYPSLAQMHDPYLMLGMQVAVERLRSALLAGEPILVYGDYDADGTVATVLLKTALERTAAGMGVAADVRYHIPHRIREGYGIQDERIAAAAGEGVRLVISVDTGIRAFAAAAEAKRVGLDLIVTDHHLPDDALGVPEAFAVLNPNQPGCPYPYKDLCGAGVAFKLAQALLENVVTTNIERSRLFEKTVPSLLKILAIATIADAVPLTGENRTIVAIGLVELRKPSRLGLRTLMQLAQIDTTRPITTYDVGFRLAPRINAAGRMDIASDVVEMFLTNDPAESVALAEKLHRLNDDRRASEAQALRAIDANIEAIAEQLPACFVLDDGEANFAWHRGVIGILASRVVDRTGRPALVVTHEDGQAFGSGRSVEGFHLLEALTEVHQQGTDPLFARFGGHAHAVGFSLASDRVSLLRARMEHVASRHLDGAEISSQLECDAEVALRELTDDFLFTLERLGPFGNGNSEPLFMSRAVRLRATPKILKEQHLRIAVEDGEGGIRFSGVAWSRKTNWAEICQAEGWGTGDAMDLAYRLRRNWHPDFGGWELEVVAIRRSAPGGDDEPVRWDQRKSFDA
jgi:single-stranded-DNA-specific exonuclease